MNAHTVLPLSLVVLGGLSQSQNAFAAEVQEPETGRSPHSLAQTPRSCPEFSRPGNFAQIRTRDGDPLRVRSSPNGRVIGAIPSGWQVIVYATDATGNWTRIGSHFGPEFDRSSPNFGFGSAPFFRAGWVSTPFLVNLGFSCDKPANLQGLVQPDLWGPREVTVNEDWVARGDRLASLARSRQQ